MDGDTGTATNAQAKRPAEEPLAAAVAKATKVEGQEQRAPKARNGDEKNGSGGEVGGGPVEVRPAAAAATAAAVVVVDKAKPRTPPKLKPKSGDKTMTCAEHPDKAFNSQSDFRHHMQTFHTRPFECIFSFANCHHTFGSKNEWKRHVNSQHLLFNYWECDRPSCLDVKSVFNRKDLFSLHVRRMHSTGPPSAAANEKVQEMVDRCRRQRRSPPPWKKCAHCGKEWGRGDEFSEKMEHVGAHMERPGTDRAWVVDQEIVEWALGERIIERLEGEKGGYQLAAVGIKAATKAQKGAAGSVAPI